MKSKVIALMLCFLLMAPPCLALNESVAVEKNTVTVSGKAEIPLQGVVLQLLAEGKTEAESLSDILYQDQAETDEQGEFSLSFTVPSGLNSGDYNLLFAYETGETKSLVVPYKNDSDVKDALQKLGSETNPSEVKLLFEQFGDSFGFDLELYNALSEAGKLKAAELYVMNKDFTSSVAAAAVMHYEGDFSDLVTGKFGEFTKIAETNAYKQFNKRINVSEIGSALKQKNISTSDEARAEFEIETGLALIKSAKSWFDVQQAVELIVPILGLDISAFKENPQAMGEAFLAKSYTKESFIEAYNAEIEKQNSNIKIIFEDVVQETVWANDSVNALYEAGIVNGVSATAFDPNGNVTREQFAKMIISLIGDTENVSDNSFSDVPSDSWFAPYVCAAKAIGIVNGVSETEFGVGQNITREQMAAMIYRAGLLLGYAPKGKPKVVTDAYLISDYAKESVDALTAGGVINGKEDGSFAPQSTATRAEAACMIYNLMRATGHNNNNLTGLEPIQGVDPFKTYADNFNSLAEKEYKERDLVSVPGWYMVSNGASYLKALKAPAGKTNEIPYTEKQKAENASDMAVAIVANNSKASCFLDTEPFFMSSKTVGKLRLEMNLYLEADSTSSNYKIFDSQFMAYEVDAGSNVLPFIYFTADGGMYYYEASGSGVRCGSYAKNTWINVCADIDTENNIYTLYLNGTAVAKNVPFASTEILWDGSDPVPALKKVRLRMGVAPDMVGNSSAYVDDFLIATYTDKPAISIKNAEGNKIALSVPENIDESSLQHISVSVNGNKVNTTGVLSGENYIITLPEPLKEGDKTEVTVGKWVATNNGVITGTAYVLQ